MVEQLTINQRNFLIQEWLKADKLLAEAKTREGNLRKDVVEHVFKSAKVGVNTLDLGNGYKLKATVKQNYTLQKDENGGYDNVTSLYDSLSEGVASLLFKWKPEMSLSTYKALHPGDREVVNTVLLITPGTPSLDFVQPKEKAE